jgi:hypothetical protein
MQIMDGNKAEMEKPKSFYASECYNNFGVFTREGYQFGNWWPSLILAQQAADLCNKAVLECPERK